MFAMMYVCTMAERNVCDQIGCSDINLDSKV